MLGILLGAIEKVIGVIVFFILLELGFREYKKFTKWLDRRW